MTFYMRWQAHQLKHALKTRRVVFLSGPRQCGKTTLVKKFISHDVSYLTLDDSALRESAILDPQNFVLHQQSTLIIDEIQRAPSLLIAIKKNVDENNRPGQYLLTGSANIQANPNTQESLAGRMTKVHLRSLSQGEVQGSQPTFLNSMFDQNLKYNFKYHTKDEIIKIAAIGGFPEAMLFDHRDRKQWHLDYVEALLERDLKDTAHINKTDAMTHLIEILAAWSSKYMDLTAIGSGLALRRETLESYINALENLYLIEKVPAWRNTDYDRVGKKPKIFMTDTGLMFSLLSWDLERIRFQSDSLGKLIETFIFNELSIQGDVHKGIYKLFHYRDREQREIDLIVEREDGLLLGVEVKSSIGVIQGDFKHLIWFKQHIAKKKSFIGIVLYMGERPLSFGDNLWAVPISMIWPAQ